MYAELISLWLPILLSTVGVFIVSSLIWTVIQWHNSDWKELPDEARAREALKGVAAGQYTVPYAADNKARQDPAWLEKAKEGPAVMMMVWAGDPTHMGKQLIQWFIYCLLVSLVVGAMASCLLQAGDAFSRVFLFTGAVAALAYAGSHPMGAIWFGHTWSRTIKDIVDGVIYAAVTAAIFGWLWPAAG